MHMITGRVDEGEWQIAVKLKGHSIKQHGLGQPELTVVGEWFAERGCALAPLDTSLYKVLGLCMSSWGTIETHGEFRIQCLKGSLTTGQSMNCLAPAAAHRAICR
jgi:hypothetical protein